MCGIIGCFGNFKINKTIFNGLRLLEYRGYDSSGIAYIDKNKIRVYKSTNSISDLENKSRVITSCLAIGHTRWATHGKVSKENTHPFTSMHQEFALVHNGTIDNYLILKDELKEYGYKFEGETDSEVIVNYLEYLYGKTNDVLKSLYLLDCKLKGSYSLVIISKDKNLYFLKNKTNLVICKDKEGYLISSDIYAFDREKVMIYELKNHQYGIINSTLKIYKKEKEVKAKFYSLNVIKQELKESSCYLEKEIKETPHLIKNEIDIYLSNKNLINSDLIKKIDESKTIYIIASGTSYHAGLVFKRLIKNDHHCEVILASEFVYDEFKIDKNDIFIFISQSGETLDVIKCMDKVKSAYKISITNNTNSYIARNSDYSLDILMGKEISVASTKAYFGEVIVLLLIYYSLTKNEENDLLILPSKLEDVLAREKEIEIMAKEIKNYKSLYFLGRGIDYDVSLECSLKLKEVTYIHSEALCSGELKHGPLALVNKKFPVIMISSQGKFNEVNNISKKEISARGGKIFEFIVDESYSLSFLLQVYFGELLSLHVGRYLKVNIDKPRNLAKSVTVE